MRILVDENIPRMTVEYLRVAGHEVHDVRGTLHQGMEDPDLWAMAMADGRMLITTDRGFTKFRKVSHNGILIVRLRQPNRQRIHYSVLLALSGYANKNGRGFSLLFETQLSACLVPVVPLRSYRILPRRSA